MQLKSKVNYTNLYFSLHKGGSTVNREDISEEMKQYLIDTFPNDFEVIRESKEVKIENQEEKLEIKTPEDKFEIETKVVKSSGRKNKA